MNLKYLLKIALASFSLLASHAAEATGKLVYSYDPSTDRMMNYPVENQTFGSDIWSYEQNYRENSLSRAARFYPQDIVGKTLMDFGCNEGGILLACHQLGASEITGIDNNDWCIDQATAKAQRQAVENANFFVGDMENKAFLSTLPQVNTVFLLAILDTSSFANKTAVIANISRLAKNTLYYEGHQTVASHVVRMQEFFLATDFTRFEYLGRFQTRVLMRFGREMMESKDVPANAITSDYPDHIVQNAEEIYWYSDSKRNPPFGAKCRLIQMVRR